MRRGVEIGWEERLFAGDVIKCHPGSLMPAKGKGALKAKSFEGQPGPSSKRRGPDGRRTRKKPEREQDTPSVRKKRKTQPSEDVSSPVRKVVVTPGQRAKWQLLPESSRAYLESLMRGLILSIIYEKPQNRGEIERHLNHLKERLLKRFESLRVPVEKQGSLKNMKKLQAEEEEKIAVIERGLAELEEEIDKAVEEAHLRDRNIASLQNKVQTLKCELAEEEEKMSQLFVKESKDVLALPKLPKESLNAPVLQDVILKIQNQEGVLSELNYIQQTKEMKAMLDSLEQAYENIYEYETQNQEGSSSSGTGLLNKVAHPRQRR
ncbi:centromere protein Q [Eublepharis macularius]|uniref:Centromere protein Q n=1 Tax=Eublepharis macularius TaxID=481883 RepID=A0AA97KKH1_EUBMA|nr:centromere protein Q [Eublepharis macularius]